MIKSFVDCLDYVFVTSEFEIIDVVELCGIADLKSPTLPNKTEPSDHLMIGASVRLPVFNVAK